MKRAVAVADAVWDAWLATRADATPFHHSRWGRAVERATGHRFDILALVGDDGGICAGVPVQRVRSSLFGPALLSAAFAVGGGILADNDADALSLSNALMEYAARHGLTTIELRGGRLPPQVWRTSANVYANFARPLATDDIAELLAIPRKHRAEVRKALAAEQRGDLTVAMGSDAAMRRDHYNVYAQSVHRLGTPVFPRRLFDAVLDAFGDDADIVTVRHKDRPVAAVLSLYHRGTVMPYWGGGTRVARHLRANDLLYFRLMSHARLRGCSRFDFGRSKYGTGAFAYKAHWGFVPVPLRYGSIALDGRTPRDLNPLNPRYRTGINAWRKLPLWTANWLGPAIARGLA